MNFDIFQSFLESILATTLRGQVVANFHAELADLPSTLIDRNKEWSEKAHAFQDAVFARIVFCYENIESYIEDDVSKSVYDSYSNVQDAARDMRINLKARYSWIDWVTFGFEGKQ